MDIDMSLGQSDEDEDSLFGSPPPSPGRGRSPSPALALPSGSSNTNSLISSTQNVGTIALPGSQHPTELHMNPLALSLSLAPRPPAQVQSSGQPSSSRTTALSVNTSVSSTPSGSRASSVTRAVRKPKAKSKAKDPSPRPPPPEIPLPDPSEPPPANFFRNQSALLGTAGIVSGVKPARLSQRHARGTTSSNPIVVEEESDTPTIGRKSKFFQPYFASIDPNKLPPASNHEIVQTLMRQKNIYPVLESILKLVASGDLGASAPKPPRPTGFERRPYPPDPHTVEEPPSKKRKLNRVPAGAGDWDIPFPFPQGEGPEEYDQTWERNRGKQLITQLVTLIKSAARKAATKNHVQQEEAKKLVELWKQQQAVWGTQNGYRPNMMDPRYRLGEYYKPEYYRPITVSYGWNNTPMLYGQGRSTDVLMDASNGKSRADGMQNYTGFSQPPASMPPTSTPSSQAFDGLLKSLLDASPEQQGDASTPGDFGSLMNVPTSDQSESATELEPGLFDSWMSILQNFPMPEEGFPSTDDAGSNAPTDQSSADVFPADFDFDAVSFLPQDMAPPGSTEGGNGAGGCDPMTGTQNMMDFSTSTHEQSSASSAISSGLPEDFQLTGQYPVIDPTLLALSMPPSSSSANWESGPPSLAASPMPSMSSLNDLDPMTPSSAGGWDPMPDIFMAGPPTQDGFLDPTQYVLRSGVGEGHQGGSFGDGLLPREKGKQKELVSEEVFNNALMARKPYAPAVPSVMGAPTGFVAAPARPFAPSGRIANREEVMRRAKERRKQLADEIVKARTELWETMIEGGALSHLARHYH